MPPSKCSHALVEPYTLYSKAEGTSPIMVLWATLTGGCGQVKTKEKPLPLRIWIKSRGVVVREELRTEGEMNEVLELVIFGLGWVLVGFLIGYFRGKSGQEMIRPGEPLLLSKLFSWAWFRHLELHEDAQYEVCDRLVCRICWTLENWLWYGGRAVP